MYVCMPSTHCTHVYRHTDMDTDTGRHTHTQRHTLLNDKSRDKKIDK